MNRKVSATTSLVVLFGVLSVSAQTIPKPLIPPGALNVKVVLFGHSWVSYMQGFQPWAFPNIPSQHISVKGHPGFTCAQLLPQVSSDVPASTDAVFIMAAINDVALHVTLRDHMACMQSMINQLIGENPHMLIELSNVEPLCQSTLGGLGDLRSAIASFNQAYATFPQLYPNNVVLVDMWTPMVQTDGWGLSNMFVDGVHFGPNGQDLVMGVIRDGLYAGLAVPR
ncbi:MAG: SGNH/GDSL hydrolase family protein [Terriglobales bacterium]